MSVNSSTNFSHIKTASVIWGGLAKLTREMWALGKLHNQQIVSRCCFRHFGQRQRLTSQCFFIRNCARGKFQLFFQICFPPLKWFNEAFCLEFRIWQLPWWAGFLRLLGGCGVGGQQKALICKLTYRGLRMYWYHRLSFRMKSVYRNWWWLSIHYRCISHRNQHFLYL